ncbi:glycoside hydrolase family 75 protein [Planotetraspora sp. A-T 1434]|uniref:glycoside hydrolase family 75 protein n=1 Tax=Planotetraspora sp. A-T 1434 TaxID=2979219 RepID=UPI0021BF77F4|nr:glycoside hydrolase family 75 protein [Planotetraspora sp. A-T 1434]MCT9931035.1 glycoside hydrolase family 75 protein [Planotetraspora sp. A-T 1434]
MRRAPRFASALLTLSVAAAGLFVTGSASAATTRLEAENATISQGVVESNHLNFSGTGFVNGDNVTGSYTEWTVNSSFAGSATLAFRYANGTTIDRPADIAVNGTVVAANQSFNSTTNWDTWATYTLTTNLNAGANKVRITSTSVNGNPNLDYIDATTPDAPVTAYQAEDATLSQAGVFSNHLGFTGTGFVDYTNVAGSYIQWTVNAAAAGSSTITFRYANGTTVNRPMDIAVNGTVVSANKAFNSTTNWDTWATSSVTANLNAGANTIRATATTANGGPNVDKIDVTGGGGGGGDTQAPTVPGGLQVTGTTSSSISLSWSASTDNVGVTGYRVYEGGTVVASPSGTTATISGLSASTSHTYNVTAVDAAGNESGHSSSVTGTTTSGSGGTVTADQLLAKITTCQQISNGKYKTDSDSGSATVPVCNKTGAVYWQADMDIDCDGVRTTQCNENTDCCYQNDTACHTSGGSPLNAATLPYVVVPSSSSIWNYTTKGIGCGTVIAVIYNGKVEYAVMGDTGPTGIIGEASYKTASDLGINPDPSNGGTDSGVTYIVFTGSGTKVAQEENHSQAVTLGNQLAQQFINNN